MITTYLLLILMTRGNQDNSTSQQILFYRQKDCLLAAEQIKKNKYVFDAFCTETYGVKQ